MKSQKRLQRDFRPRLKLRGLFHESRQRRGLHKENEATQGEFQIPEIEIWEGRRKNSSCKFQDHVFRDDEMSLSLNYGGACHKAGVATISPSLLDYFLLKDSSFSLTAALTRSAVDVYSGCFKRYFSICSSRGSGNETVRYPFGIDYANSKPYLIELQYSSRICSGKGYILRYVYFNYDGKWRGEESARLQIGFAS